MKVFHIIGGWLNSLAARITLLVLLALFLAQVVAVFVLAQNSERERSEQVSEQFMRQLSGLVDLFNSAPDINRAQYIRTVSSPGLNYWVADKPVVAADLKPGADWPNLPQNWNLVRSSDKRLAWFADARPLTVRYTIAPVPMAGPPGPGGSEGNTMLPGAGLNRGGPNGPNGPGPNGDRGRPPPPGQNDPNRPPDPNRPDPNRPDHGFGGPDNRPPPPRANAQSAPGPINPGDEYITPEARSLSPFHPPLPSGAHPIIVGTRWRVSVALDDGQWLNAEHMYEAGLAPWLRTVLNENSIMLVLMIVFVAPLVSLGTYRLTQLSRAADRLGRGEDTEPLTETGASEIRRLTHAFNNMSLRLRRFVQGRTQMLAGISHDLRTPITALRLRADLVEDDENRERMQALVDDMQHLTEATLTLAKDKSYTEKTDKVDISSLIEGICDDLNDAGIDATAEVERGVHLICRPHSLRRAIRNVAENGAKYGKRSRIHMNGDARNVRIIVDDDGPGIPENQRDRAFQPFVRLESSRNRETGGSGLGLAITRSIILNHGGDIALANRKEGGLRVTITLPKAQDA